MASEASFEKISNFYPIFPDLSREAIYFLEPINFAALQHVLSNLSNISLKVISFDLRANSSISFLVFVEF